MRYLLFFLPLFLISCAEEKIGYTLLSCDKHSCKILAELRTNLDCLNLANDISTLHNKILKDKPSVILNCVEKEL